MSDPVLLVLARSLGAGVLALGALSACTADTDAAAGRASVPATEALESDLPDTCADGFPFAREQPDLGTLENVPADWPEPPVPSTLCETSTTLDDTVEVAGYATDAGEAAMLDAYEQALTGYDVVREDTGAGEKLTATSAGGTVEVMAPSQGTFSVFFSPAG
ncbi:hypothetical protein [Aeromicrobium sp. IC_218]|uniref:hypothetical protein n=1 Tax=Aeromicrobium sp. IC_218 TaxID=2545468 RepID=UPI00103CE664|nr:hypothetical protein [Aeromicrobium sp. IC_218]TCI98732.1 hypothetical protein E0W78_10225 [Aeromicrobium sp. IC_218]